MKRILVLVAVVLAGLPASAQADRAPTKLERRALEHKVSVPSGCAKLWISTVSSRWARYDGAKLTKRCRAHASDGRTLLRKVAGKWHQAFAGSDIVCPLAKVPNSVLRDLEFCPTWKVTRAQATDAALADGQDVAGTAAADLSSPAPAVRVVSCSRPDVYYWMDCKVSFEAAESPGIHCTPLSVRVTADVPEGLPSVERLGPEPSCWVE